MDSDAVIPGRDEAARCGGGEAREDFNLTKFIHRVTQPSRDGRSSSSAHTTKAPAPPPNLWPGPAARAPA